VISLLFRQLRWFTRFPYFPEILCLLVAIGIAVWSKNEVAIRWTGIVLQLFGVFEAAYGIRQTRKLFKRPTFGRQWLAERPRKLTPISGVGNAAGFSLVRSRGRARTGVPPGATIQQRLARLEQNYETIFDELGTETSVLRAKDAEIEEKLRSEEGERKTGDSTVSNQLAETAIGGLRLQFSGVMLLLAGIIMGTASPEIADPYTAFCKLVAAWGSVCRP